MKNFNVPELQVIENVMLEPVYAASGMDGWNIYTTWENHNSGSHSELKIHAHNHSQNSGYNLSMDFVIDGFKLATITPGDGCLSVTNQTENTFTLTRSDRKFNPGENIGFVIQLTAKDSQYKGAVGVSGQPCSATVKCVSFRIS